MALSISVCYPSAALLIVSQVGATTLSLLLCSYHSALTTPLVRCYHCSNIYLLCYSPSE